MTTAQILLDEHVGRVFDRLLRKRGHEVEQAKDRFGEYTTDDALLQWCADNSVVLVTNNVSDFEPLHRGHDHGRDTSLLRAGASRHRFRGAREDC
ncbi:DUF5615 family PIN-like protein [Haloquadratum walsbyi]|uniref:DUF5615 family PIN-like protein n=1 Tax=Haloquadratum walsbyi TaxID=293091 RepID=UPI001E5F55ED|nr:DUF5615 family PIN-like protein [Haloquadratum walsbyi]